MTLNLNKVGDDMEKMTFAHQYTVEGYITFTISVVSRGFSGVSSFCISESSLKEAIYTLSEMYNNLKGSYQMNDYDSDDFISFEFQNLGHIGISGQVGGSHREQYLKYQFMTDQTVLTEIISDFKSMIK
jgi:hypothetical protein